MLYWPLSARSSHSETSIKNPQTSEACGCSFQNLESRTCVQKKKSHLLFCCFELHLFHFCPWLPSGKNDEPNHQFIMSCLLINKLILKKSSCTNYTNPTWPKALLGVKQSCFQESLPALTRHLSLVNPLTQSCRSIILVLQICAKISSQQVVPSKSKESKQLHLCSLRTKRFLRFWFWILSWSSTSSDRLRRKKQGWQFEGPGPSGPWYRGPSKWAPIHCQKVPYSSTFLSIVYAPHVSCTSAYSNPQAEETTNQYDHLGVSPSHHPYK